VPHWRTFNLLRTHLLCERPLSGEIDRDRETIITALRSGAAWLIWPCVARARGARMWAESSDGSTIGIGAEGSVGSSVLRLRLPRSADVTVLRDGAAIHAGHSGQLDLDIPDRGTYRVEARIDGRFWLLSNPIHLR